MKSFIVTLLLTLFISTQSVGNCLHKPWMNDPTDTNLPPDLTGDCTVDFTDLTIMLGSWGGCDDLALRCGCDPKNFCCRPDLNRDGMIGIEDLTDLLEAMAMEVG